MSWQELASTSHYRTAVAIAERLAEGHVDDASDGLGELIEAVARSERRALRSQLVRLMAHILKWRARPSHRSASWAVTILQAREEIAAIREEVPSLTREVIEAMWDDCFRSAARQVEAEMGSFPEVAGLDWDDVFEVAYLLSSRGPKPAGG